MNATKEYWQNLLVSQLPPEEHVRERNEAISASYANWYRNHPDWFRWAGMAAFASYRVGLLLAIYDFSYTTETVIDTNNTYRSDDQKEVMLTSIDMLRQANNKAFANSGWAHLAYESPKGGIAIVEQGLSDDPTQVHLLEGFRLIERGRLLREQAPSKKVEADDLFWSGNLLLLQHEQWGVIQQHFQQLKFELGLALTVITSLEFTANHLIIDRRSYCEFFKYMWTFGFTKLLATFSLPDITKLAHRWAWVRRQVFPTWKKVVRTDSYLPLKIEGIIRAAAPFDPEIWHRLVIPQQSPEGQ